MGLYDWLKPDSSTNKPKSSENLITWLRNKFGGYPGSTAILLDQKNPSGQVQSLTTEQVSSGPQGITIPWYPPYLSYLDQQQGYSPEMQQAFRLMMADSNVKAAVTTQILGVAALDLQITPVSKSYRDGEIANFTKYVFSECLEGGLAGLVWNIFSGGMIDGYSLNEKIIGVDQSGDWAGKIVLEQLKPKDVGNDVVILTDRFRNIVGIQGLRYNAGEEYDPARFVIFRYQPLYDSPVGQSALRAAYRPWWCMRMANTLRTVMLERRATPIVMGTYTNGGQKATLDAALGALSSRNWLSVPESVRVEVLNVAGTADEVFASAIKDYKHEIFLAIQAASLPNIEGQVSDGRGNTKVQQGQADLFKWYLSQSLLSILNDRKTGLIRDIVDLNYVTPHYPKASLSAVDQEEVAAELRNYYTGWEMGLDFSKAELYEKFGWKPPTSKEDCLPGKPAAGAGGAGGPQPPDDGSPQPPDDQGDQQGQQDQGDSFSAYRSQEVAGNAGFPISKEWMDWIRRRGKATRS